jgi:energy-coupling factor transport system permease protein
VRNPRALHALTWAWWVLAGAAAIQVAPNPAYVALVTAIAWLVVVSHARPGPLARAFPFLLSVAAVFVLVRVVLAALTTHGGDDVLFTLPAAELPRLLGGFTLGGTVEASVVLRSVTEGLVVLGVIAVFGAFNAVVSHDELVRSAPRAFHEVGLILTVALAFVPATVAAIAQVREADQARTGGRTVRRGRLLRLTVPLLESGMERAMSLAESMDSRGFAHHGAGQAERRAGWLALAGLLALGSAFAALVGRQRPIAGVLAGVGVLAVLGAVAVASRGSRRPRYRALRPGRHDLLAMGLVTLAPLGVALLAVAGEPTLRWNPVDGAPFGFSPWVALALGGLAAPALWPREVERTSAVPVGTGATP